MDDFFDDELDFDLWDDGSGGADMAGLLMDSVWTRSVSDMSLASTMATAPPNRPDSRPRLWRPHDQVGRTRGLAPPHT